jgi:hypothetical protein
MHFRYAQYKPSNEKQYFRYAQYKQSDAFLVYALFNQDSSYMKLKFLLTWPTEGNQDSYLDDGVAEGTLLELLATIYLLVLALRPLSPRRRCRRRPSLRLPLAGLGDRGRRQGIEAEN